MTVIVEVDKSKKYSGKSDDVSCTGAEGQQTVQENFWVSDSHDCIEGYLYSGEICSRNIFKVVIYPQKDLNA